MRQTGASHLHRLLAFLLTAALLMTTCFTPALAANIWDGLVLNIHWTEGGQTWTAVPVEDSIDHAYWVSADPAALNQTLTLEAISSDPACSFYFMDEWGNRTDSFTWLPEMDAQGTGYEYAHQLWYEVDGVQADMPVLLYVSSASMPEGGTEFQPYPVQVPVYYITEDGVTLDTQYVECWAGETTPVWAGSRNTADYALIGADSVDVYVDQSGAASPAEVIFTYRALQVATPEPTEVPTPEPVSEVAVPVVYYHVNGTQLDFQEIFLVPGDHVVEANSDKVAGYQPTGDTRVYITVYPDGTTDQGSIVFMYEDAYVAPSEFAVPVVYYHVNGTQLDFQEIYLVPGTHAIEANSDKVAGYQPVGDTTVYITVYEDGTTDQGSVVFQYEDAYVAPVEAFIPVYYYHADGSLLDMQELKLTEGTHTIKPDSAKVAGLELEGASSAEVTVYADGSASVAYVQFIYKDAYVAPAEAMIPVYYYHADGSLLDMQELKLTEGTHTIKPDSAKVAGLELEGASSAEVTVYADGSANVAYVQFIYKDAYVAPVEAVIPVYYYHADGSLMDMQELKLTEGTHTIKPDSAKVAELELEGASSAEVTVYADGSANVAYVQFIYREPQKDAVLAELTVLYLLEDQTIFSRDTLILTPGTHTILADTSKAENFVLVGEQSHEVYVDETGYISPESVSFIVRQPSATITVHYQDDRGRDVAPVQTFTYVDGTYVITAAPEGLSGEYELAPGLHTEVTVTVADGKPSQSDVYFYYQQKQTEPVRASVTVHYLDTYGAEIAPAQTVALEAGVHQLKAEPVGLPAGAELVSDATITVEVYENGTFSPQEVAFYYRTAQSEEKTATITIFYRDDRGNDVAAPVTREYGSGTHIIHAEPADLPEGYEIFTGTDASVEVTVRDGVASKSQIVFYYQKTNVTPTVFRLPVNYYDTMGEVIAATQYVEVAAGTYAIKANPVDLPEGYELMMEEVQTVIVNQDGTTEPEEIAFYYRAPEKKATIIVVYMNKDGQNIIVPFTMELSAGSHTIEADASRVPGGYDIASAKPVQVYVSREGEANPSQISFTFERLIVETPIPVGEFVYRYAAVNSKSVAFRTEPTTSGGNKTVIKRLNKNDKVYVLQEQYNDKGEVWAMVNIDGRTGYMMSEYLDVMTQQKSDEYAANATPVPTFTPEPTATPVPTATPTQEPTDVPTPTPIVELITPPSPSPSLEPLPEESPTEEPTATPTASPSPTPYTGYALTTRATALRTGVSASDMSIIQTLEANELVNVINQVSDPTTGETWSIVSTLNNQPGFVQDSSLRPITQKEAEPYILLWQEKNATPAPTELVTATPEPMQLQGYGVVLGDEVPFRQMASEFSRIIDNLQAGTIVYITGQTPADGQYWHSVNYDGYWGYIRTDLVRMLTIAEEEDYIDSLNATPTPTQEPDEPVFDANGLSSYGYVEGSSVNWREGASTNAKRIGELKRYAFCLVMDTEYVDGVTWYNVRYGDQEGYIHGDFFKQMTIAELEDFLGSDEYLQGVANNSAAGDSAMDDVGFTGTGGIVSAEDQWINKNPDVYASFEPFNPIGTVAPITNSPTLEPLPGVTQAPTATPSPTPAFNPLPDVTYPISDDGEGGSTVIWIVVIGLLVLAVGGVFALVRYQQNRRRIAMRAAQRRAQAARAQQQRPYARTAAQNQPRTGTYPNQQTSVRRPAAQQPANEQSVQAANQYKPYSGNAGYTGSYYRPAESAQEQESDSSVRSEDTVQQPARVGRRTAYRQAHGETNSSDQNSSLDM